MSLICIDIDGTLVTPEQTIPASARKAVRRLVERGHTVLMCTGRAMPEILPEMWDLGFHGVISAAGAYVKIGDEVVADERMEEAELRRLTGILEDRGAIWMWQAPSRFSPGPRFFEVFTGHPEAVGTPWEKYARHIRPFLVEGIPESANKGVFAFPRGSLDDVVSLRPVVGPDYQVIPGSFESDQGYGGEIIMRGVNKAHGLDLVADYLGVSLGDTVAVGDSLNDLEVMGHAARSIAMGNAHQAVKDIATIVTADVSADGLAAGLEELGLLR